MVPLFFFYSMNILQWSRAFPCEKRFYPDTNPENFVCVCNSSYCDSVEPEGDLMDTHAVLYTTSQKGAPLEREIVEFRNGTSRETHSVRIRIDPRQTFGTVIGFGGAFTDSTGARYSLGRVPIASTDFSTSEYSYDDTPNDFSLSKFRLMKEDLNYKIPFLREALNLTKGTLRLFASPWSAPAWMKTSGKMSGQGELIAGDAYMKTWAKYYVRFFEEYARRGIYFWATTVQNEPTSGAIPGYSWQTMYWNASGERDFIRDYLGPALQKSEAAKNVTVIGLDDNRFWLKNWAGTMYSDESAARYVSGMGIHWYLNWLAPASVISDTLKKFPDKFVLATEACAGSFPFHGPILGDWQRAAHYASDIIETLSQGVSGWTDWNLALNMSGGPTWVDNRVDAPILIDAQKDEFLKQPMFFAMTHFSRFIRPGAVRIHSSASGNDAVKVVAFVKDGTRVVVLVSGDSKETSVYLEEVGSLTHNLSLSLPARSIVTLLWKKGGRVEA